MQGSIYTTFSEMIIEKMGMSVWNDLLEKVTLESGGVYTNGMQYNDAEIMSLVTALSEMTKVDIPTLVKSFGEYLFIHLYNSSPAKISHIDNLKDFLADLKDRDREIFKKRLLSEVPQSLQSIADGYGVSRERIRQIEAKILQKMRDHPTSIKIKDRF